jgi:hypothetical protein
MIKIKQNSNFKDFFQVFNVDGLIDEFRGEAMAIKKASKLARRNNQQKIIIESNGDDSSVKNLKIISVKKY